MVLKSALDSTPDLPKKKKEKMQERLIAWGKRFCPLLKREQLFSCNAKGTVGTVSRLWNTVERAHLSYYHLQNQSWNAHRTTVWKPTLTQPKLDLNPLTKCSNLSSSKSATRNEREKEIPKSRSSTPVQADPRRIKLLIAAKIFLCIYQGEETETEKEWCFVAPYNVIIFCLKI